MTIIYVALLDEGTDVWRPVEAAHVSADCYEILTAPASGERPQFSVGQIVRCEPKRLSGGICLVAIEAISN